MTPAPGPHLTPDDLDAWLAGALAPAAQDHLSHCPSCQERADTEREIVALLSALPLVSPAPGFADRVMARAAGLLALVVGSMAGSIVWTLGHQETLAALGGWLVGQAGQLAWLGVRGVASNFIEQPWFEGLKALAAHPGRLALASALAVVAYLGGILALRRLLALP